MLIAWFVQEHVCERESKGHLGGDYRAHDEIIRCMEDDCMTPALRDWFSYVFLLKMCADLHETKLVYMRGMCHTSYLRNVALILSTRLPLADEAPVRKKNATCTATTSKWTHTLGTGCQSLQLWKRTRRWNNEGNEGSAEERVSQNH